MTPLDHVRDAESFLDQAQDHFENAIERGRVDDLIRFKVETLIDLAKTHTALAALAIPTSKEI